MTILDIELDKCPACKGIWCDKGELERIRGLEKTGVEQYLDKAYELTEHEPGEVKGYMVCPRCEDKLREFRYTYFQPVMLDRCQSCFGIWLDGTELTLALQEQDYVAKPMPATIDSERMPATANHPSAYYGTKGTAVSGWWMNNAMFALAQFPRCRRQLGLCPQLADR